MASMAKKVDHAGVVYQFCRNHVKCAHKIKTMLAFIHQMCMGTSRQKTNKSDHLAVHLLHTSGQNGFVTMPVHILQLWHCTRPHLEIASCLTLSEHHLCWHIWLTCQSGYSSQRHRTHTCFEWSAHEHVCPLPVQPHWHMHLASLHKWRGLTTHLCVEFVETVPRPSALAHIISHVPISWNSKRRNHMIAVCWTLF
jgi:hypothetical protein